MGSNLSGHTKDSMKKAAKAGSVVQPVEPPTFNRTDESSTLSGPTIDILLVKKCERCKSPLYIRITDTEPVFAGCEAVIVDIRLERVNDQEILIKGRRSSKAVRCSQCQKKHLLRGFDEVKVGAIWIYRNSKR